MPPLIVQSPRQSDNAADPGEFFWRETVLKLKVFSFESAKQSQEVIKTKHPFANKGIGIPTPVQETDILTRKTCNY